MFSAEQDLNASSLICKTLARFSEYKLEQDIKHCSPKYSTLERSICASELQPLKAFSPIDLTDDAKPTEYKVVQPEKALLGIDVIVLGIVIDVNLVLAKAYSFNLTREDKSADNSLVCLNALLSILVTLPRLILVRFDASLKAEIPM